MAVLHRKTFYIMRHGQTHDNAAGLISGGGRDPDLTEFGMEQARVASGAFALLSLQPTRIVASGLRRTHQTAALVASHIACLHDSRLDERGLGELDGRITEAQQITMGALPGEESVAEQSLRVLSSMNHYLADDELTLFVSHGGTLRRVLEATGLKGKVEAHNGVIYGLKPDGDGWAVAAIASSPI